MDWSDEALATDIFGVPRTDESASVTDVLDALSQCGRWQSHLAWVAYNQAALLHRLTLTTPPEKDLRVIDGDANTALHISGIYHLPKSGGDSFLVESLALVNRIPLIGECLRDGIITQAQYKQLVIRTDLIADESYSGEVDSAIARELRGAGAASTRRLHDLVDRIICRHDPDNVRHRRERAIGKRSVHSRRLTDGMAMIGITATAEEAAMAMAAVEALANSVCKHDPRNPHARRSDAAISCLQGLPFRCQCGLDDCEATTDEQDITDRHAQIVLHVIWEAPTPGGDLFPAGGPDNTPDAGPTPGLAGPTPRPDGDGPDGGGPGSSDTRPPARVPRPQQLGFLDGYGVISADHVRDIANRPDTIIRPLNPNPGQPLAPHLPSDPYRFSAALDTFIRARDGYCVFPGCNLPAWFCDLDHVDEFDHRNPARGGQTCKINANAKCRYHHIFKTFSDWLDDQYIGRDGLTHTEFITPDGYRIHTQGHTNEELFPALRDIRFHAPSPPRPPSPDVSPSTGEQAAACDPARAGPARRRTRLADKLARRRHERKLNRIARERRGEEPAVD